MKVNAEGVVSKDARESKIDVMREESIRLINLTQKKLKDVAGIKNLLAADASAGNKTLSKIGVDELVAMLEAEKAKLLNLEMVLAVIGTVKAGKSTTINAIVGKEVMPVRDTPMTTLPTLVRHTPGQVVPVLHLPNVVKINDLTYQFFRSDEGAIKAQRSIAGDAQLENALQSLRESPVFPPESEGAEESFKTLKRLNDLVRLLNYVAGSGPRGLFASKESLPVIRVEFETLKDRVGGEGVFTLLDTPGPNESGSHALREIVAEQVKDSSAVLAIIDYTQLKSSATEKIQEDIEEVDYLNDAGSLYVAVNKFDQAGHHGMEDGELISLVAKLFRDVAKKDLEPAHVIPVSARRAYLANKAVSEVIATGRLSESDWVKDFGEAAFGMMWEHDVADSDRVMRAAKILHEKSRFSTLTNSVVAQMHAQASLKALHVAGKKVEHCLVTLGRFLKLRSSALSSNSKAAKAMADKAGKALQEIQACKEMATENRKKLLEELNASVDSRLESLNQEVAECLELYIKTGGFEADEKAGNEHDVAGRHGRIKISDKFRKALRAHISKRKEAEAFDPSRDTTRFFDKKEDAERVVEGFLQGVRSLFNAFEQVLASDLSAIVVNFESDYLSGVVKESVRIVRKLEDDLNYGSEGSAELVIFNLGVPEKINIGVTVSEAFSGVVAAVSDKVTKKRESSDILAGARRLLGSIFSQPDWGYDVERKDVDKFKVDASRLQNKVKEELDRVGSVIANQVEASVTGPLQQSTDDYLARFSDLVDKAIGDLVQGMEDHNLASQEFGQLLNDVESLRKAMFSVAEDANCLRKEISDLLVGAN